MRNLYTQRGTVRWAQVLMLLTIVIISGAIAGALLALHLAKNNTISARANLQGSAAVLSVPAALTTASTLSIAGSMEQPIGINVAQSFPSEMTYSTEADTYFQVIHTDNVDLFNKTITVTGELSFPAVEVAELLGDETDVRADIVMPIELELALSGGKTAFRSLLTYEKKHFVQKDAPVSFNIEGLLSGIAQAALRKSGQVETRYITQMDFSQHPVTVKSSLMPITASLTNDIADTTK